VNGRPQLIHFSKRRADARDRVRIELALATMMAIAAVHRLSPAAGDPSRAREKTMNKLRLEIDDLLVESFAADAGTAEGGTVDAQSLPTRPLCTSNCGTGNYCNTATCTVDVCC
jgi:hypothetical protein